ncbi:MAG: T9SS type A sorting domain-containing protein [Bacteroidetes bacterium]|nr:T9SS type A sorting domain-containing protein [Bacteroidota bacterium]MBL6942943.1 T9SS type A sorting domain-containing protein [Bacteroidales bacterium]
MKKRMFTYLMFVCFPILLFAQWSIDPSVNTKIIDTIGEQVLPKVAVNSDNGESYISWFSEFGDQQFDVYMQRLDVNGNSLWDADGLLISNHPTMSWVTDYDLVIDNDGCAVLVTQDLRTGGSNVYAYRISPDGEFLWGEDGIALTYDNDFNPSPKAVIDQDGNILFAWASEPSDTTQFIQIFLQKLSTDGQFLWDDNTQIRKDSLHCWMPQILPLEDNSTIVAWIETATTDTAMGAWPNMYPYAQKIDSNGGLVWPNNVAIDTLDNMPLAPFFPSLVSDGNSGFFISWMAFPEGQFYTSYVQHINSGGVPQWTSNGVNVSNLIQFQHSDPALTYLTQEDELFVFWNEWREYSSSDVQCAIFGQKFSNIGERLWTDEGEMFEGWYSCFDTLTYINGISSATDTDFALFFEKEYMDLSPDTLVVTNYHAMRINKDGGFVWNSEKALISSANSTKFSLVFSDLVDNQWIVAWSDNRNDPQHEWENGIYAQNINIDGNIGPVGIEENNEFTSSTIINYPNPFSRSTTVKYSIAETGNVNISLFDSKGNYIKSIFNGISVKGTHTLTFDSFDLSPGIYLYKITTDNYSAYNKMLIIK